MSQHTILLIQPTEKLVSRTWSDHETTSDCCEAVCKIFEEHLRKVYPNDPTIKYDIRDLFRFIDHLADLSCLVFDDTTNQYTPQNKDWIKENIMAMLRKQSMVAK